MIDIYGQINHTVSPFFSFQGFKNLFFFGKHLCCLISGYFMVVTEQVDEAMDQQPHQSLMAGDTFLDRLAIGGINRDNDIAQQIVAGIFIVLHRERKNIGWPFFLPVIAVQGGHALIINQQDAQFCFGQAVSQEEPGGNQLKAR